MTDAVISAGTGAGGMVAAGAGGGDIHRAADDVSPAVSGAAEVSSASTKKKSNRPSYRILNDLRATAALMCLTFNYEDNSPVIKDQQAMMEKRFFGNQAEGVASFLDQMLEGTGAFSSLYNLNETKDGIERVLKRSVSWGDTKHKWIAGKHFDRDLLLLKAYTKPASGHIAGVALHRWATTALKNAKKALSLVKKLSFAVQVDSSGRIIGYASGIKEQDFMRKIRDGMFYLLEVCDPDFDQDPQSMSPSNTEDDCPSGKDSIALEADMSLEASDDVLGLGDGGGGNVDMEERCSRYGDLFSHSAPDIWTFTGWMAFYIFGPLFEYQSLLLQTEGNKKEIGQKKETSPASPRPRQKEKSTNARNAGHSERGMSLETKFRLANVAQADEAADQAYRDHRLAIIAQLIQSKNTGIANSWRMYDVLKDKDILLEIQMEQKAVKSLEAELVELKDQLRKPNKVTSMVLEHASVTMASSNRKRKCNEVDEE